MKIGVNNDLRVHILFISFGIIFWICFLLIGSCSLFFFNITITATSVWILNILFVLLYSLLLLKKEKWQLQQISYFWLIFITIIIVCGLVEFYFYDFSDDGLSYHGTIVYGLSKGWNPCYSAYQPFSFRSLYELRYLQINHFPKSAEITWANFYAMFYNIELAKIPNLLFMISTFGLLYYLFQQFIWMNKTLKWIFAILIACNPVSSCQFLSFMLDGQLASLLTIMITILILFSIQTNKYDWILKSLLLLIIIYAINIKFTALIYVLFIIANFILWLFISKRFKMYFKMIFLHFSIAFIVGIAIVGYSSYIKNTINFKNPFYPVDQKYRQNVESLTPINLLKDNRFLGYAKTLFARTGSHDYYANNIEYKIPFTIYQKELTKFAFSVVMIGGMGVWFGSIFCISILLFILAFIYDTSLKRKYSVLFLLMVILLSCFLSPIPWWARFVPQTYLIPFIGTLYFYYIFSKKIKIVYGMIFLFSINLLLLILPYIIYSFIVTYRVKNQLKNMQQSQQKYAVDFYDECSYKFHLEKYHIKYKSMPLNQFYSKPDTLYRSLVIFTPLK